MESRPAGGTSAGRRILRVVGAGASVVVALSIIALFTLADPSVWLPWVPPLVIDSPDVSMLERAANVALFVPLGAALGGWWPTRWGFVVVGTMVSATIEILQRWLPDRVPDVLDVVMNSVGTAIGFVVAALVVQRAKRRRRIHRDRRVD